MKSAYSWHTPQEHALTTADTKRKQAAAAALLAQLYFNAVAYIGEEHFDECAEICRDIIGGVYGQRLGNILGLE